MKIRWIYLPLLIVIFSSQSVICAEEEWTERKLGRLSSRTSQAAQEKNWTQAIAYSEQLLEGTKALDGPNSIRYVTFLKNLNRFHDKAGRLKEVSERVKEAYLLSKSKLGAAHPTTKICRTLYYKLHVSNQNYREAIPLVIENISILRDDYGDGHKHIQYLKQLYSLYGLSGQLEKEEETLLDFLALDKHLYNRSDEDNIKIIINLANNYCRQNKIVKFNQLTQRHKLQYFCE